MPLALTDSSTASCPSSVAPRNGCRTIPSIQPKTVVVAAIPSAKSKHCDRCQGRGPAEDTASRTGGLQGCLACGFLPFGCSLAS